METICPRVKIFAICTFLLISSYQSFCQISFTVTGGPCNGGATVTNTGTTNGKPSYDNGGAISLSWSGIQWEGYNGATLLFTNTFDSYQPPCLGSGVWNTTAFCTGGAITNITGDCDTELPVDLISFELSYDDNQVSLDWSTASELNNEGFFVQYSADGIDWQTLDFLSGNGTTNQTQNYSYIHAFVYGDLAYYRIKQVDFDGQFEIFPARSISLNRIESFSIYPNPAQEYIFTPQPNKEVSIYNIAGNLVLRTTAKEDGKTDVSNLKKGHYVIVFSTENESLVQKTLLVIN